MCRVQPLAPLACPARLSVRGWGGRHPCRTIFSSRSVGDGTRLRPRGCRARGAARSQAQLSAACRCPLPPHAPDLARTGPAPQTSRALGAPGQGSRRARGHIAGQPCTSGRCRQRSPSDRRPPRLIREQVAHPLAWRTCAFAAGVVHLPLRRIPLHACSHAMCPQVHSNTLDFGKQTDLPPTSARRRFDSGRVQHCVRRFVRSKRTSKRKEACVERVLVQLTQQPAARSGVHTAGLWAAAPPCSRQGRRGRAVRAGPARSAPAGPGRGRSAAAAGRGSHRRPSWMPA